MQISEHQIIDQLNAILQHAELSKKSTFKDDSIRKLVIEGISALQTALATPEAQLNFFTNLTYRSLIDNLKKIVLTRTNYYNFYCAEIKWLWEPLEERQFFKDLIKHSPELVQASLFDAQYDWSAWEAWSDAVDSQGKFEAAMKLSWYSLAFQLVPIKQALTDDKLNLLLKQQLLPVLFWILDNVRRSRHAVASDSMSQMFADLFALNNVTILNQFMPMLANNGDVGHAKAAGKYTTVPAWFDAEGGARVKLRRYRNRLLLGECDFTFTEALLRKQAQKAPGLGYAITATEFRRFDVLISDLVNAKRNIKDQYHVAKELIERLLWLHQQGVTLQFNVDATRLHETHSISHYPRIHFNYPFATADLGKKSHEQGGRSHTLDLSQAFFKSAAQIQAAGDRLHISMNDPANHWFQENAYNLPAASMASHYRLFKVRNFNERYEGYVPKHSNDIGFVGDEDAREFVFEKQQAAVEIAYLRNSQPTVVAKHFTYVTEGDSSSYESEPDLNAQSDPMQLIS